MKNAPRAHRRGSRRSKFERLERRHLLAAVPDLFQWQADAGGPLEAYGPFHLTTDFPTGSGVPAATLSGVTFLGKFPDTPIIEHATANDFDVSSNALPIDPQATYVLSGWGRSGDAFAQRFDPLNRQSFGVRSYDVDGNPILGMHVERVPLSTDTRLSYVLRPGDSTIYLEDATGWSNATDPRNRLLAWYGYTNQQGFTYPEYTYTRQIAGDPATGGLWNVGGVNALTNAIQLSQPWTGPTLPAGTAVRNAMAGHDADWIALQNQPVSSGEPVVSGQPAKPGFGWNHFTGVVGANTAQGATHFRPGAASLRIATLSNQHGDTGNWIAWRDLTLSTVRPDVSVMQARQRAVFDLRGTDASIAGATLSLTSHEPNPDRTQFTRERVLIDPDVAYTFSAVATDELNLPNKTQFGIASYDADGALIHPLHTNRYPGATDSYLAATLAPGATSILVQNASGWSNTNAESATTRSLAWYGYRNGAGTVYPDFTYTRNIAFDFDAGLWNPGAIVFDNAAGAYRIALRSPWIGPTLVAGSAIRNAASGNVYQMSETVRDPGEKPISFANASRGPVVASRNRQSISFGDVPFDADGPSARALRPGTVAIEPVLNVYQNWVGDLRIHRAGAVPHDEIDTSTFRGSREITLSDSLETIASDSRVWIDTDDRITLHAEAYAARGSGNAADPAETHSLGYFAYDVDGNSILPQHVRRYATAVDTQLAIPLVPGATTIVLANATGWNRHGADGANRLLAWYGYASRDGVVYPDYSYTRHAAGDPDVGLWDAGAIQGNTITLRSPWTGPTLPVGTAVRNAVAGEALFPVLMDHEMIPSAWTDRRAEISGEWSSGIPTASEFPPGTRAIAAGVIANQSELSFDDRLILRRFIIHSTPSDSRIAVASTAWTLKLPLDVLANDTGSAAIVSVGAPVFGTATIDLGAGPAGRDRVLYQAPAGFSGIDRFTYTARHHITGALTTAAVEVRVLGDNLAFDGTLRDSLMQQSVLPQDSVANGNLSVYDEEYTTLAGRTLTVNGTHHRRVNETDLHTMGLQTRVRLIEGPKYGSLSLNADGSFVYRSNGSVPGEVDAFRYEVSDGQHLDEGVATIRVFDDPRDAVENTLKTIHRATIDFHNTYNRFPPGFAASHFDPTGQPYLSWRVYLLPFLGYEDLFDQFHLNEPWNSPNNAALMDRMPAVFADLSLPAEGNTTRYHRVASDGALLFRTMAPLNATPLQFVHVTDGTVNTLLFVQSGGDRKAVWTQPNELPFNFASPLATLGQFDDGYLGSISLDGEVYFIPESLDGPTFKALLTREAIPVSNSELVDLPELIQRQDRRLFGDDVGRFESKASDERRLKRLTLALENYIWAFDRTPNSTAHHLLPDGSAALSWRVRLLPFMEYQVLFRQFRLNEPWDSPTNSALAANMPDVFRSAMGDFDALTTRFNALYGTDNRTSTALPPGAFPFAAPRDIKDGILNTAAIVRGGEDRGVIWTKPEDLPFQLANPLAALGTIADDEILIASLDQRVHRFGRDLSGAALSAMATPDANLVYGAGTPPIAEADDPERHAERERQRVGSTAIASTFAPTDESNRMRSIALAFQEYHASFGVFPVQNGAGFFNADGTAKLSWRVHLLAFLNQSELYERFHLDEPWDSPNNLALLPLMPEVYRSVGVPWDRGFTSLQTFAGHYPTQSQNGPLFFTNRTGPGLRDIFDGTSETILFAESGPDKAVPWTKPQDIPYTPDNLFDGLGEIGSSFRVAWADGGLTELPSTLGRNQLRFAVTPHDRATADWPYAAWGNPGFAVTPSDGRTVVRESGVLDSFDVVLTGQPKQPVTVRITSGSPGLVSDLTEVTFTNVTWNLPQRITLRTADDLVVNGSRTASVQVDVDPARSDVTFTTVAAQSVQVLILDNDSALAPTIHVVSVIPRSDGFQVNFSGPVDRTRFNLYDANGGLLGPADFTVVGATVGAIAGSVVFSDEADELTFIVSGAVLPDDTYTLRLRSALNGIAQSDMSWLDGNGDGLAGDDFETIITLPPAQSQANTVMVSLPDFVRGPGQDVNLPLSTDIGIPVKLSTGQNVRRVAFELHYDPERLDLSSFATSISGAEVEFGWISPGQLYVSVERRTEFASVGGAMELGRLIARVPNAAAWKSSQVLRLERVVVEDVLLLQRIPRVNDGLQVVALLGDSSGNQTYSSGDVTLLQRLIVGLGTGFAAYPHFDPRLIADINASGTLSSGDATLLQRHIVGINVGQIPAKRGESAKLVPATTRAAITDLLMVQWPSGFTQPDERLKTKRR